MDCPGITSDLKQTCDAGYLVSSGSDVETESVSTRGFKLTTYHIVGLLLGPGISILTAGTGGKSCKRIIERDSKRTRLNDCAGFRVSEMYARLR